MFILAALTACFAVCISRPHLSMTLFMEQSQIAFFYAVSLQSTASERSLSDIVSYKCCKALLFLLGCLCFPSGFPLLTYMNNT